jgi:hypothetical protein
MMTAGDVNTACARRAISLTIPGFWFDDDIALDHEIL